MQVDLNSVEAVHDAIQQIVTKLGTIDVVVNNAGYGQLGALEELSAEEARKNFDVKY